MSKKGQGRAYQWIVAHQNYAGDDCLPWPFGKNWDGYGHFGYMGKLLKSARFMCTLVNGEPPTPKHQAAHSCGNGNKGCMNPRHLSWKTASENQLDRRLHGTFKKSGGPRRKLTVAQIDEVRRSKGLVSQVKLAKRLGVTRSVIEYWQKTGHEPVPPSTSRYARYYHARRAAEKAASP